MCAPGCTHGQKGACACACVYATSSLDQSLPPATDAILYMGAVITCASRVYWGAPTLRSFLSLTCVCTRAGVSASAHVHMHACTHACVGVRGCVCMRICMCGCGCERGGAVCVCMCVCMYACVHVCVHVCMCACVHAGVCMCVCVSTWANGAAHAILMSTSTSKAQQKYPAKLRNYKN